MTGNLATRLHTGIRQSHGAAEHAGFMQQFLQGKIDRSSFACLLSKLYLVYSTLETALEANRDHPAIAAIDFNALHRTASLEQDLEFFFGCDWQAVLPDSKAARDYAKYLRRLATSEPVLLIAHAYTRYLGDLSGGQLLKQIARRALALEGCAGTRFYEFTDLPSPETFKAEYRRALDSLELDETIIERLIVEANLAFRFNLALLGELEPVSTAAL